MAYLPLSTANLPDPAINPAQGSSPTDYFNTVTYTGNSSNPASVTGVGFQPDFVWVKTRSFGNTNHRLQDVVRGSNKRLMSDLTSAEIDTAGGIQSFDSDGFTVGDGTSKDGFIHFAARTFAAWNWKANGSGVSNTDGSITSTVSANTESGFSIVSYSGATDGSTVGHGLNQAPELVIFKNRDISSGWFVMGYPTNPTFTADGSYLLLDGTSAMQDSGGNEIEIGSSLITFVDAGSSIGGANSLTDRIIAYCFHSVEGFSKIGSYTGNGNANGTFVYTGFRPAFILIKSSTVSGSAWYLFDEERNIYNPLTFDLYANYSNAESGSSSGRLDMLSNGFKMRSTSADTNSNGATMIYMAFAENPFKYSLAR